MIMRRIQPPFLSRGDEVAIVSSSFVVSRTAIEGAVELLNSYGLKVRLGKNVFNARGPFAGSDAERIHDLQNAINDKNIKAVFFSRGGYGIIRIIDKIDFSPLKRYPKWFIGFSDITVFHSWLTERCNMVSIHGEMPVNYVNTDKTASTVESLMNAVFGHKISIEWNKNCIRPSNAEGIVAGGNLSLLYALTGTPAATNTKNKILFIEDVGEQYYHIDRMLTSLRLAGKLDHIAALIVGGFSKMEDTNIPWKQSIEDIVTSITERYDYPVFFDFPAGHIKDNRAFYINKKAKIVVLEKTVKLEYV